MTRSSHCFAEMVVDADSAVAEEGEVAEPPLPLLNEIIQWKKTDLLPLDASVAPPPESQWSMVAIRDHQGHGCDNPPIIFPPINHENLQISPDPPPTPNKIAHIHADNEQISFSDADSDSDSNSSSTFSPSDSSPVPRSPLFSDPMETPADNEAGWFQHPWTEMLNSKVNGLARFFCSVFTSSRGVFLTFRSATFAAILIAFLYFRRRRRLAAGEESRNRLIGIIKERDEKINQLLDQISRMNQILLPLHRIPSSSTP